MHSGAATKSAPPAAVVCATKSRIAFLASPSFHDGSGSDCAAAVEATTKGAAAIPRDKSRHRNTLSHPHRNFTRHAKEPATQFLALSAIERGRHLVPMRARAALAIAVVIQRA